MSKQLSCKKRGQQLYDQLLELYENGELAKCQCRYDIVDLLGYTPEQRPTGHVWVSNLISRGYMTESIDDDYVCHYSIDVNNPYVGKRLGRNPKAENNLVKEHGMSKDTLDQLMIEYDWKKNTLEDNLYFLSFMTDLYSKIDVKGE